MTPRTISIPLLALLLVPGLPAVAGPAPRAEVVDPVHDAGVVPRGETVDHDFEIRNSGEAALEIREVRPNCGCSVADFDASIPPGEVGRVRVAVDTTSFRGAIAKGATVFTNDVATPTLRLTLKAEVRPFVEVVPDYVRLLQVRGEEPATTTHRLWFPGDDEAEVTGAGSPFPYIRASVRPAGEEDRDPDGPARQWLLVTELSPEAPRGPLTGEVVVETDHPRRPQRAIPITGFVQEPLTVTPPRIDLGTFAATEPRKASVLVNNVGGEPVRITGVETDVEGLRTEVEEEEGSEELAIYLTLAPGHPPGPVEGTLTVRTTSERLPTLEVPIRGSVR